VLLVGDAAGLIEGFTGEGIYWALRSGQLAAQAIVSTSEADAPRRYEEAIDRELMPDLIEARRLAHFYQWLPHSVYALPTRMPAAWRGMQKILRGERRFVDVRAKLGAMGRLVGWVPARF
jgi:flavin-dependent dehydrogenase